MGLDPATLFLGGASLLSGFLGSDASKNAADTQAASADKATALQKEMFDKQVELQQPWRDAGTAGLNQLLLKLGLTPGGDGSLSHNFSMADFQADPGYQFRLDQGTQAQQRGAAAMGMIGSGRYLKDLTRFSQGLASQEYGNAYDRFNNNNNIQFNRLASVSGIGQTAANNIGSAAQNFGSEAGGNIIGAGNARAAGTIGGANALSSAFGSGWNLYQQNNLMKMLQPNAGGTGFTPTNSASNSGNYYSSDYGQFL